MCPYYVVDVQNTYKKTLIKFGRNFWCELEDIKHHSYNQYIFSKYLAKFSSNVIQVFNISNIFILFNKIHFYAIYISNPV